MQDLFFCTLFLQIQHTEQRCCQMASTAATVTVWEHLNHFTILTSTLCKDGWSVNKLSKQNTIKLLTFRGASGIFLKNILHSWWRRQYWNWGKKRIIVVTFDCSQHGWNSSSNHPWSKLNTMTEVLDFHFIQMLKMYWS